MTDEQIIELLATKVMGWWKQNAKGLKVPGGGMMPALSPAWVDPHTGHKHDLAFWNPIKHIQHAWMVVEKLGRWHGFDFMIMHECFTWLVDQPVFWTAGWFEDGNEGPESRCSAESETVTRAICLAALKAHGIEV